jgi:tRNA (cmo5U34)-methyltransferase
LKRPPRRDVLAGNGAGGMTRDRTFQGTASRASDFAFDEQVAEVFDDMLERSVPFYKEQQALIQEVARRFYQPGTFMYDLGCSTGTTLMALAKVLGPQARLVGYDNSEPMLAKARANIASAGFGDQIELRHADLNGDMAKVELSNASVVTLCWTLQFVRPLNRDTLVRAIHDGMTNGGTLLVTEKVLTNNSDVNRYFIDFYYDFKRRNGYSEGEISKKREALENVLIPYRVDENFELLRRCGFQVVETFFQWYNFAGFMAVKQG